MNSTPFTSPLFGETRTPTDEERAILQKFAAEIPVCVFQELNKHCNGIGLMISIDAKRDAN
jgi:hypothetical protein